MAKRRCKVGDVVRIVYSKKPGLIGRTAVVEEWMDQYGKWGICLIGQRIVGIGLETGKVISSLRAAFKDSSLEPIFPEPIDATFQSVEEVSHG